MGTVLDLPLHGTSKPPPPALKRVRGEMRRRAQRSVRLLERGKWVSDGMGYQSRNTASKCVVRLKDVLVNLEGVERDRITSRIRELDDGWHWWLGFKDKAPQA